MDDDVDVQVWKLRLQPPGDFDCRIARIAHAEDDLELRVILLAAGTQVSYKPGRCRCRKGYDYRPGRGRTARVRSSLAMTLTGVAGKTLN